MAAPAFRFLAILILTTVCCYGEEEPHPILIPVGSHTIAGEIGSDTELLCNKPEGNEIEWLLPSGEKASKNVSVDRVTQLEGNLQIKNVSWEDGGSYICRTTNGSLNDTVQLKAFVMPSYETEGVIILAVNCALLLIFFICLIVSTVQNRKRRKAEKAAKMSYKKTSEAYT